MLLSRAVVHQGGAVAAPVGAREQPRLSAESDAAQGSFGGIVGETHTPVLEEAREGGPAPEHVVHGLRGFGMARQTRPFRAHPGLEIVHELQRPLPAHAEALARRQAIDGPLDREDRVHPPDRLEGEWGDDRQLATCLCGNVGQDEELAPGMTPARRFDERGRLSLLLVEAVEPGISVGLQDASIAGEVILRMFSAAIPRVVEDRRRRTRAPEGRSSRT